MTEVETTDGHLKRVLSWEAHPAIRQGEGSCNIPAVMGRRVLPKLATRTHPVYFVVIKMTIMSATGNGRYSII